MGEADAEKNKYHFKMHQTIWNVKTYLKISEKEVKQFITEIQIH